MATFASPTTQRDSSLSNTSSPELSGRSSTGRSSRRRTEAEAEAEATATAAAGTSRERSAVSTTDAPSEALLSAARVGTQTAWGRLDEGTRAWTERRLGDDFSRVRVHTGGAASAAARAINAQAYTLEQDVVFGPGEYQPHTTPGQHLLAHELAHVSQQRRTRVSSVMRQQLDEDPRSLHETLAPSLLTDEVLDHEISVLARWLGRQTTGTERTAQLTQTLDELRTERQRRNGARGSAGRAPSTPTAPSSAIVPHSGPSATGQLPTGTAATTQVPDPQPRSPLGPSEATRQRLEHIIRSGPLPQETRVIGAAIIEVDGYRGPRELRAVSSSSTDELGVGAAVPHATTPETRTLRPARSIAGSGARREFPFSHVNDAEIKIFEQIAATLPPGATGRISFLTMRSRQGGSILEPIPACSSCTNATFEIAGRFRGVEVASYAAVHPTSTVDLGRTSTPTPGSTTTPANRAASGAANRTLTTSSSPTADRGTRAEIGTPDMRGMAVGGPSARGQGAVAGVQLAFMGANFVLNLVNDHIQEGRTEAALREIEPVLTERRRQQPQLGVLLVFFYSQIQPSPDSLVQPGAVFGHIEEGFGRTRDEAREHWRAQPQLRPGRSRNTSELTQEVWISPVVAPTVAALRTPFPKVALARFRSGSERLQDVEWGGVTGFDDEGSSTVRVPPGVTPSFVVLQIPRRLHFWNGSTRVEVDIPLINRATASGGSLQVVDLDPIVPGHASAACVFPADDTTDALFAGTTGTKDNLDQLGIHTNFHRARWVAPENVEVVSPF